MIEKRLIIADQYNFIGTLDMYFSGRRIGFLDIETTGLNPKKAHVIMVGVLTYCYGEASPAEFVQFAAESLDEEKALLKKTAELLSDIDIVVSYNGNTFDLPFLRQRAEVYNTDCRDMQMNMFACDELKLNMGCTVDLYEIFKRYSGFKNFLPNMRQKTVEDFLGLWEKREDKVSGAESVKMYFDYLEACRRSDVDSAQELMRLMCLHNSDDVLQLARLPIAFDKFNHHKAFFYSGFHVEPDLIVEKISFGDEKLIISGRKMNKTMENKFFNDSDAAFSAEFDAYSGLFDFRVPLIRKNDLLCIDLLRLENGNDSEAFNELEKYPACQSGFLVICRGESVNYQELNNFVIVFLSTYGRKNDENCGKT